MEPKWVPKWSQNQAEERGASGTPGAIGELFGGSRSSPEAPQSAPGEHQEAQSEPQEVQTEPQEAPNDPQEGQHEPQEGQSELREVPGGFRERFGKDFRGISKQREATETFPIQIAGEGA